MIDRSVEIGCGFTANEGFEVLLRELGAEEQQFGTTLELLTEAGFDELSVIHAESCWGVFATVSLASVNPKYDSYPTRVMTLQELPIATKLQLERMRERLVNAPSFSEDSVTPIGVYALPLEL